MCGGLFNNLDFIKNQIDNFSDIVEFSKSLDGIVILGYISIDGFDENGFPILINSVAIIDKGNFTTYDKQILSNINHNEDNKYFYKGNDTKVFNVIFTKCR